MTATSGIARRARRRTIATVALSASFALGALVGCGDGNSEQQPADSAVAAEPTTTLTGTRLTPAQANLFARALFNNYEQGGATFEATVPFGVATFTLRGEIDWKRHVGTAAMTTTFTDGVRAPITENIAWSSSTVVTPLAGLTAAMEAQGRPGITHVARPLDPRNAQLDRVLAYIDALSSDRPENPLLLRQKDGVEFLGAETIDGQALDRFASGPNAQFWLDSTGKIARSQASFAGMEQPIQVTLAEHGVRTPQFPVESAVVRSTDLGDLYGELVAAAKLPQ
jgi:hypothetical protein